MPLSFTKDQDIADFFLQIEQVFSAIVFLPPSQSPKFALSYHTSLCNTRPIAKLKKMAKIIKNILSSIKEDFLKSEIFYGTENTFFQKILKIFSVDNFSKTKCL